MKIIVLSRQHHLLPFARRLVQEGHDVETIVYHGGKHAKYENAYSGVIEFTLHAGDKGRAKAIQSLVEIASEATTDNPVAVFTNDDQALKDFYEVPLLYPRIRQKFHPTGTLRLGAWFDGEAFHSEHLLVVDEGHQPAGLGATGDAGLTLIRAMGSGLEWIRSTIAPQADELKGRSFRGLVQWDLTREETPQLGKGRMLGWPPLHSHAFVSELEDFGGVLSGKVPELKTAFTVVLHLSQAPWPHRTGHPIAETPITLDKSAMSRTFFHDIQAEQESGAVSTAGLDGWVGVVRGAADSFELAQSRALETAASINFFEKQYRGDVGMRVRHALGVLEEQFKVTFA